VSGQWWEVGDANRPEVSLEREYAERNGLVVGDKLQFDIEGRPLEVVVTSIREVAWDNLRPNFYIILSPGSLDDFPSTVLTSFYLDRSKKAVLNDLLREYPTVTIIEVDAIIEQVQLIIAQVTLAIEFVLGLILLAGATVLIASLQASMDERMRQFVILRTLGAANGLIIKSLAFEFLVLGAMAGLVAALGAEVSVYYLETEVFELQYAMSPELWVLGPLMGAALIAAIGLWFTRGLVRVSPALILRQLA
jgi:putative ABC transport system permease protein